MLDDFNYSLIQEKELKIINAWRVKRGIQGEFDYCSLGEMVFLGDEPIVAGFLRLIQGNYAFLDGLITNPDASPEIRDQAIDLLVTQLINVGKKMGFRKIIAFSSDANTLIRSKKHGFIKQPDTVIALDLSQKG